MRTLESMRIQFIVAPFEADAQLPYMLTQARRLRLLCS